MSTLSPPLLELAFEVHSSALPANTRVLTGRRVEYDTLIGVTTKVPVPGIVGVSEGVEMVAVGPSSIAVLAEAEPDGSPYASDEAETLRLRIRTRFTEMAAQIDFIYAAILVEEPLESVEQLVASNGGSYAFRTFALSASSFDENVVGSVLHLLPEAHSERFEWGWFISSARNMMPAGVTKPGLSYDEGTERSLSVSALLASALQAKR